MKDAICSSGLAYTASILVPVPPETAFPVLADGMRQAEWTLGSWNRRKENELFVGTSLFDGQETWVQIDADPALLSVDYRVGRTAGALRFGVTARVLPAPSFGGIDGSSLVLVTTWRTADMSEEEWRKTIVTLEAEMFLIRGALVR